MKCLQSVFILFAVILGSALSVNGFFYEQTFSQRLLPIDQFETRRWDNRYYLDDSAYVPGGPMFLSTGAYEMYSTEHWLNNTHFFDMGREMNALLVYTEHRFYGQSRPTADLSMVNLQFLDTRYAVDDVANLLTHLRNEYETGPVIAHGFDHGGAIATWLAHRHPQLVDGVWAASATVLAEKNYNRFLTNVAEDIRVIGGDQCYRQTEQAFQEMEDYFAAGNFEELEQAFNLCTNFTDGNSLEAFAFFYMHALALGDLIRFNHRAGVEGLCLFYWFYEDPMRGLGYYLNGLLGRCIPIDGTESLENLQNIAWDTPSDVRDSRQLMYQYCREFGWYITTTGDNHPFGNRFPLEVFREQCETLFGPIFSAPNMMTFMDQTNQIFGGNRPNVRNAYFTVGEYDPSKDLGVLESYGPTIYVDIIPDFGAGAEVQTAGTYDYPQVNAVQARARQLITQWIDEASTK